MTTITFPTTTNVSPQILLILAAVLAPLILGLVVAFGAMTAPAPMTEPLPTNQNNSDDPTPLSGVLEFAD